MLSIKEMKELAQKEVKAEKELAEIKYNKDLAMYRTRLKEVKPKLIEYIEKCIYNGIKNNSKIGLYRCQIDDMFKPIEEYGDSVLIYLADTTSFLGGIAYKRNFSSFSLPSNSLIFRQFLIV